MQRNAIRSLFMASVLALLPFTASAAPFTDVPSDSPYFQAVEYLRGKGIFRGYDDGSFRPGNAVSRAEALKIIMAPLLKGLPAPTPASPFSDVPAGAWFVPFVEEARTRGIVAGPPARPSFRPGDTVRRAEFLKMFFLAQGIDTASAYGELTLPLASDVRPSDWYFPLMRYALSTSMVIVGKDGNLSPGAGLTRGDVALLLFHHAMYKEMRRTQALLTEAENEVMNVVRMIDEKRLEQAELASARSLVAARGALEENPDHGVVKGAVKITEGFQSIVKAYRAGTEGRLDDVIAESKEAWADAQKARGFSASLETLSAQMQSIAKDMADDARTLKKQQGG